MSISNTSPTAGPYAGNGSATAFPVGFPFPDNASVRVVLARPGLPDAPLVLDTDYTLSGAGAAGGGTLSFPKPGSAYPVLASGQTLHIRRVLPLTQPQAWSAADAIDVARIEAGDDRLTMICQQLQEQLDRAVQWPPTASAGQVDAAGYLSDLETARDQALAAQIHGEEAQAAAEDAMDGAQAARAAAQDARDAAEAARGGAQAAHAAAALARDEAREALADTAAEHAGALADISAQGEAQTARVAAEGDAQVERVGTTHTHAMAGVTGLQAALDGKAAASHAHAIADVTSLQTSLDAKAAATHAHAQADVTGLSAALAAKSDTSHGHSGVYEPANASLLKGDTAATLAAGYSTSLVTIADAASPTIAPASGNIQKWTFGAARTFPSISPAASGVWVFLLYPSGYALNGVPAAWKAIGGMGVSKFDATKTCNFLVVTYDGTNTFYQVLPSAS